MHLTLGAVACSVGSMKNEIALTPENVPSFVTAGKAIFTVQSKKTGARFTFRVRASKDDGRHFVQVLSGPDNTSDYQYLGCVFDGSKYAHGKKSKIGPEAPSAVAFAWFWRCLQAKQLTSVEVYHHGRCGRCGRLLTVPESIQAGLGPECAGK